MFMKFMAIRHSGGWNDGTLHTDIHEIYVDIKKIQLISPHDDEHSFVHLITEDAFFGQQLKVKGKALDIVRKIARGVAEQ